MPPLKPGKIVNTKGKVVNAPVEKSQSANVREDRKPAPKATTKPKSDTVQAARVESASKKSADANAKAYKKSIPSLTSSFKGVGVTPYLNKDGNVPTINPGTNVSKSSGPSGGGGGGTSFDETVIETNPSMDPVPTPTTTTTQEPVVVKTPTRNVTDISSLVPQYDAEYIKKLLFENLSAIELSIVERHDTIEGINQKYSIISNLSEIRKKYDIARQLTVMDKFKPLTRIFTINIEDKIPQEDYIILEDLTATYQYLDENNEIVTREKGYYYIDTNGDLVIELIGLERNQEVEVQIDTNGTIYRVESWLQQMARIS